MSAPEQKSKVAGAGGNGPSIHAEDNLERVADSELLWRLWHYVRPYRVIFWALLTVLPVASALMLLQPYLLKIGIDRYVETGDVAGLSGVAAIFFAAVLGEFAALYLQYYLTMSVAQRSLADLRRELFDHMERLPQAFFDRNPVGRLVTRVTTDVDVLNEAFATGAMTIFMDLLTLSGIVALLLWLDWRLALATLTVVPILLLAINFFRKRARVTYRTIRERIARINSFLQEAISGMSIIQLFAHEKESYDEFAAHNGAHRDANHLSNIYEASLFSIVEAVSSVSMAIVVWYGSGQILAGVIAFGTLVAFIEYMQKFFIPIRDFSAKYAVLQSAMTAAERIFQLLDTETETETTPADVEPVSPHEAGAVVFDNVWFAYNGEDWVLRDVSLSVSPGETVAIVGATGSGKTTLTKLLGRSFEVGRGAVRVSGRDVREWDLGGLRKEVGIVLQDAFLFTGTVASNVALGRDGVTEDDLWRTVRAANLGEFVESLPRGMNEPIRERGNNLSAGQRQLLAMARALAYDPRILVMDEATSSVDTETEQRIQEALEHLLEGRTAIVIAHRLSTVERADRIVVLHKGEVREVGTHAELLERGEIYARLYELQYAGARARSTESPVGDVSA
ncbi:MAG: ABC transporter ATP-binding protein [Candidatus Binatia bacterium]|nr:ABC transporter ATP-binding protein [Candidatus Binatia bacterium]